VDDECGREEEGMVLLRDSGCRERGESVEGNNGSRAKEERKVIA
jgi:hypothetical protein